MEKYSVYYRLLSNPSKHYICKNVNFAIAQEILSDFISINFSSCDLDCVIMLKHSELFADNFHVLDDLEHSTFPNFDYCIKFYCSFEV